MKSIFFILTIVLSCTLASAQSSSDAKHDVRLGYGVLSDVQMAAAFATGLKVIFSGISGEPVSTDYHSFGPLTASYNFYLTKRISIGPEINFIQLNFTDRYSNGDVFKSQFYFTSVSGRFDYRFLNQEGIQIYSGIALGGTYGYYHSTDPVKSDKSGALLSYQINLFGIRVGKILAGYMEVGFGRNGLLNFGVSKKF